MFSHGLDTYTYSLFLNCNLYSIWFVSFLLNAIRILLIYELYGSLQVDAALIATGRAPFTQGLGLENVSQL